MPNMGLRAQSRWSPVEWKEPSMADEDRPSGHGIKWRARRRGDPVPYWFASRRAIEKGYPVKAVNLSGSSNVLERAKRLQTEMLSWLDGPRNLVSFDGTFRSLLDLYERDPESKFHTIEESSRSSYSVYLRKLYRHIGPLRIDGCDGRDVSRWFAIWRDDNGRDRLKRAKMTMAVLKAALRFGVICRQPGCRDFQIILGELRFETPVSRTHAPTAEQMIAARSAAHENGAPLRALVYALQFETTLRQWDIVGKWVGLSDPRPSAITFKSKKWIGPMVASIDGRMILKVTPSKTRKTTGVTLTFDLAACPMVQEEIAALTGRSGPLIVNERTGRPYSPVEFNDGWRADYALAGLPADLWNRDTRAGGVTEGTRSGASKDDRRMLAGHAREETTDIYDREQIEVHRRVMASRTTWRKNSTKTD